MVRSAYKSQKQQQSRQKRGNKNKAVLIIVFTKMSMSHHVADVDYSFIHKKSVSQAVTQSMLTPRRDDVKQTNYHVAFSAYLRTNMERSSLITI
jgi:hypothetical protein